MINFTREEITNFCYTSNPGFEHLKAIVKLVIKNELVEVEGKSIAEHEPPDEQNISLTKSQVLKIFDNPGATINLQAIMENYDSLRSLGISKKYIVEIASRRGGSLGLKEIKEHYYTFTIDLGFTQNQVVTIAKYSSGQDALSLIVYSCHIRTVNPATPEQRMA